MFFQAKPFGVKNGSVIDLNGRFYMPVLNYYVDGMEHPMANPMAIIKLVCFARVTVTLGPWGKCLVKTAHARWQY